MARDLMLLFHTQCAQQQLKSLVLEAKLTSQTYFSQTGLHNLKLLANLFLPLSKNTMHTDHYLHAETIPSHQGWRARLP